MIVTSIRGRVQAGQLNNAAPFLGKYVDLVKEITGVEANIAGRLGAIGEVMVFAQFENANDYQEAVGKLWASEAYRQVMDEGAEIFDGEATDVSVWSVADD